MSFAGQGDRSGGLVTPSLNVTGLSPADGADRRRHREGDQPAWRRLQRRASSLPGSSAKLFGLDPAERAASSAPASRLTGVPDVRDAGARRRVDAEAERRAAPQCGRQANAAELGAAATTLKNDVDTLARRPRAARERPDEPAGPRGETSTTSPATSTRSFGQVEASPALPQAQKQQLATIAQRIQDQLENAAAVDGRGERTDRVRDGG